jgi:alpha-methylacyl-CoA racemase
MKPLESCRVLEVAMYLPAPMTGLILSDLGADVVKVESPPDGDPMRLLGGDFSSRGGRAFHSFNRGKRSCLLNLKDPDGREAMRCLAKKSDVMIVSLRPSTLQRLGIDHASMEKLNPGLVYCSVSGYGLDGPWANRAGHDMNYQSAAGIVHLSRDDEGNVVFPPVPMADIFGAFHAATAVLAALLERRDTGRGRLVDVSLAESALTVNLFNMALTDLPGESFEARGRMLSGRYPFYNAYAAKDGRWLTLGAIEAKFWNRFCEVAGRPDLAPRQFDITARRDVKDLFASRTFDEWMELFRNEDVCLEPVFDYDHVINHPQHRYRKTFSADSDKVLAFDHPPFAPDPARLEAPLLGEHTAAVLGECGAPAGLIRKVAGRNR